jgi:hypothetical protein
MLENGDENLIELWVNGFHHAYVLKVVQARIFPEEKEKNI